MNTEEEIQTAIEDLNKGEFIKASWQSVHFWYTLCMNTKFVGIKEFRQKISEYARQARIQKTRFVIVNHNKPLFELLPFAEGKTIESLFNEVLQAKKDISEGRVYSQDEILAELA